MATYIVLINYTQQGIKTARESPDRFERSRHEARAFGCEVKAFYATFGPYDFIEIIDAPDDPSIAKLVLSVASAGNVRTTTLRAFDQQEFSEVTGDLR